MTDLKTRLRAIAHAETGFVGNTALAAVERIEELESELERIHDVLDGMPVDFDDWGPPA